MGSLRFSMHALSVSCVCGRSAGHYRAAAFTEADEDRFREMVCGEKGKVEGKVTVPNKNR